MVVEECAVDCGGRASCAGLGAARRAMGLVGALARFARRFREKGSLDLGPHQAAAHQVHGSAARAQLSARRCHRQ